MLQASGSVGFAQAGEVQVHGRWGMKATFANAGFQRFQLTKEATKGATNHEPQFSFSATERVKARGPL